MTNVVKTQRLILRRFTPEDGHDLHAYLSDPETVKYEPYDVFTVEEAREEAARRANDPNFWAVCLRETNKLIGNLYFARQQPEEFDTWELGYVFNRATGGNGYATEAARAILRYAFEERGAHRIVAHCNPDNVRSWKLLERLSLRREGHFLNAVFFKRDESGAPLCHDAYAYGLLESEWRKLTH